MTVFRACVADFDCGGIVTSEDYFTFLPFFFSGHAAADVNGDGVVSAADFFEFVDAFFGGC